jgi:hypothetical protein
VSAPIGRDPLSAARAVARVLDSVARVPGTKVRVGLDPLLGLVPGLGDVTGAVLSGYIVFVGARLGAPPSVIWRMLLNVAIDTVVGSIPILGDVFDAGWKSNVRNVDLLERYVAEPGAAAAGSRFVIVATVMVLGVLAAAGATVTYLLIRALITAFR